MKQVIAAFLLTYMFSLSFGALAEGNTDIAPSKIEFNAELWQQHKDRAHMVDDLMQNRHLIGMNRAEAQKLLGLSDPLKRNSKHNCLWFGLKSFSVGVSKKVPSLELQFVQDKITSVALVTCDSTTTMPAETPIPDLN